MKIKLKKNQIVFFMILFPFFEPRAVAIFSGFAHKLYTMSRFIICVMIVIFLIRKNVIQDKIKRNREVDDINYNNDFDTKRGFLLSLIAYRVIGMISLLVNGQWNLNEAVKSIGILLLLIYMLTNITKPKICYEALKAMYYMLNLITLLSVLMQFMYPSGFGYDATSNLIYFWNTRNHMYTLFLATMIVNITYGYYKNGRVSLLQIMSIFVILADIIYLWSATAVVGMGVFVLLILLLRMRFKPICIFFSHPILVMLTGVGLNIAIVIFRIQEFFSYFIVNILHRDLTFSYRIYIWDLSIAKILQRFWFGYGQDSIITYRFSSMHIADVIPHNEFLDILVLYGFFAFLAFVFMMYFVGRQLKKYSNYSQIQTITVAIFSMLICCITEKLSPAEPLYLIVALSWLFPVLEASREKKETRRTIHFRFGVK